MDVSQHDRRTQVNKSKQGGGTWRNSKWSSVTVSCFLTFTVFQIRTLNLNFRKSFMLLAVGGVLLYYLPHTEDMHVVPEEEGLLWSDIFVVGCLKQRPMILSKHLLWFAHEPLLFHERDWHTYSTAAYCHVHHCPPVTRDYMSSDGASALKNSRGNTFGNTFGDPIMCMTC